MLDATNLSFEPMRKIPLPADLWHANFALIDSAADEFESHIV